MGEAKETAVVRCHLTKKEQVVLGNIVMAIDAKTRVDRRSKEKVITDFKLDWIVDILDTPVDVDKLADEIYKDFNTKKQQAGVSERQALIATINQLQRRIQPFDQYMTSEPVYFETDRNTLAWLMEKLDALNGGEKMIVQGTRDIYLSRIESRLASAKEGVWTPPPGLESPAALPAPEAKSEPVTVPA